MRCPVTSDATQVLLSHRSEPNENDPDGSTTGGNVEGLRFSHAGFVVAKQLDELLDYEVVFLKCVYNGRGASSHYGTCRSPTQFRDH
jgi:hypothetical protein